MSVCNGERSSRAVDVVNRQSCVWVECRLLMVELLVRVESSHLVISRRRCQSLVVCCVTQHSDKNVSWCIISHCNTVNRCIIIHHNTTNWRAPWKNRICSTTIKQKITPKTSDAAEYIWSCSVLPPEIVMQEACYSLNVHRYMHLAWRSWVEEPNNTL